VVDLLPLANQRPLSAVSLFSKERINCLTTSVSVLSSCWENSLNISDSRCETRKFFLIDTTMYIDRMYSNCMLLGFKTELNLNNEQRTALSKHAGIARHAWNWGLWLTENILKHNQTNPDEKLKFPSAIDLHKLLVATVKPENPWYYEVSKCAPQYALRQLREAWDRCFKRVSQAPNFKRKGVHDSFTLDGTIKILGSHQIQVPIIGVLRTFESLPQIKPKTAIISRQSEKWFINDRVFHCPHCNESIDRDLNAAKNIERIGLSLSSLRLVDGVVPTPPVEAGKFQFVSKR
jgi:transposase